MVSLSLWLIRLLFSASVILYWNLDFRRLHCPHRMLKHMLCIWDHYVYFANLAGILREQLGLNTMNLVMINLTPYGEKQHNITIQIF